RDQRSPLLSLRQWTSLSAALAVEELQVMVVVGDAPFVLDSILDSRMKGNHQSQAELKHSWPYHGGELLRLLRALVDWKACQTPGGEPR
ncbi:unnamed protein product, partial [Discosporangium mesarthrocarpum]